jgi:hypothetical protein
MRLASTPVPTHQGTRKRIQRTAGERSVPGHIRLSLLQDTPINVV